MKTETITPLDVREGDIIYTQGYRVVASDIVHTDGVARYTLTSAGQRKLPPGYEGMRSGGNQLAAVTREGK